MDDSDRTASLMTPSKLAQVKPKGPGTPAAWLDQMAADAGHPHVRRLAELREELKAQAARRDFAPLAAELAGLAEALPRLDFSLLEPKGWWARATGKSRSAGAEFSAQFEQLERAAKALAGQAQALQKQQQEHAGPADLALLELEVEFHAIDKIIEQGTRWLHDMRNQLKARQAAAADEAAHQQIKDDGARCEILVQRLKALRAVSSAAQQAHQQALGAASRRAALVQMLQQMVATNMKSWRTRLAALASAAGDKDSPALSMEAPEEAHRELQLCLKQAAADCNQLQGQEKILAESLGVLGTQLQSVAA